MREAAKSLGGILVGGLVLAGIALLGALLLKGTVWFSEVIFPWINLAAALAFLISIFVLLPLALFKATRAVSGLGLFFASYVFGALLWVWSILATYSLWGGLGLFAGLILGGIGVVPLAILATLCKGLWSLFGQLILLAVITLISRSFGLRLVLKTES